MLLNKMLSNMIILLSLLITVKCLAELLEFKMAPPSETKFSITSLRLRILSASR